MIALQRQQGIYLTCLGIGMGNYKDSKIQTLAQRGNGNFAYLDSYTEAEKVLLKEFTQTLYAVADDAFLDVNFNPAIVKEYRLIGFDNKVGAIKDTSTTVEGGEIGSAYSALVAFEIVPELPVAAWANAERKDDVVSYKLHYKLPRTTAALELTEKPGLTLQPFHSVSKDLQFASAVIMFGSMLRKSKFVKDLTWNTILQVANEAADVNNFSQKEFLSILQQAKTLYGKKRKKEKDE